MLGIGRRLNSEQLNQSEYEYITKGRREMHKRFGEKCQQKEAIWKSTCRCGEKVDFEQS
jgi:hypothetical protein